METAAIEAFLGKLRLLNTAALTITIDECDAILRQIEHEETMGPLLDPTRWRPAAGAWQRMETLREVVETFKRYRAALARVGEGV